MILFLDESGDHNLIKIDPAYPVFVLGGIIVSENYAWTHLEQQLNKFKFRLFGRTDIVLHTADIVRQKNCFAQLADFEFRHIFYSELNKLMASLDFKVVACAIKKELYVDKYGALSIDPYFLSLRILVERFCFELGEITASGYLIAEKRNPTFDNQLELAWLNLKISGTRFLKAADISRRISHLTLAGKGQNIAGLQIADLVVSPIGRHVIGKKSHPDFEIIESKFRKKPGAASYLGSGLVILPNN